MPRAAPSPTRTACLVPVPRLPVACRRTMPFRTSCGRPDPAAVAGLRDHDRVCPALSGPQRSRHSRCHLTATALIQARQMPQEAASEARLRDRDKRGLPVALNPTLMIWPGRLARPTACPRIMFFHSSCGSPNSAAGVVCGGLRPACPALSGPQRSQKSKCRAIHTVTRATPPRGARAAVMNNGTQIPRKTRGPQAVASPIPMI